MVGLELRKIKNRYNYNVKFKQESFKPNMYDSS